MRALRRRSRWISAGAGLCLGLLLLFGGGPAEAEDEAAAPQWASHVTGLEAIGVSSLRIHPKSPERLMGCIPGQGFSISTDGGKTWKAEKEGVEARHVAGPRDACEISLDPRDEKIVWLTTKGHVYRSADQGDTWKNVTTQALSSYSWDQLTHTYLIRGVVVDPTNSRHVFAGTFTGGAWRGGLFETTTGGENWKQIAGQKREEEKDIYDAWPIVLDPRTDKNVAMGGSNGFWFSDKGGRDPHRADPGEIGRHHVRALTELSGRSRDIFACDGRGLWSSRDGGKRWNKKRHVEGDCVTVYSDPHSRKRIYVIKRDVGLLVSEDTRHTKWEVLGHADAEIQQILGHPRDKEILFLASPVTGLYVSRDQGKTIEPVAPNISPVVPAVVTVSLHPVAVDRAMALTDQGVAFLSRDRGENWERAGRIGMRADLLVGDPANENTWWVAGSVLRRSVDNGATWETQYAPSDPEERILELRWLEDGSIRLLLERSKTIARTDDGGKTWKISKTPRRAPNCWAASFDVDPANAEHLLMAARSLRPLWTPKDEEGGPWESWDGGKTWDPLHDGLFEGKNPKRNWNRGAYAAIDPATRVSFYAADGLGLFARLPTDTAVKAGEAPWVNIGPSLPNLRVVAAVLVPAPGEEKDSTLFLQAEGANDTRTFVRTTTRRVLARLQAAGEEGADGGEAGSVWEELPDAPARLADLTADPHLPGRLLGCDESGVSGVLAYGVPGARPVTEKPPEEGAAPGEGPEVAGATPPDGLLAFTGGADAAIRVWGLSEGKVYSSLRGNKDEVLAITLAPDETVVASGGLERAVRLYDAGDGSLKERMLAPETHDAVVNALAFHPDSKRLYVGMEQNWAVVEWNLETGDSRIFEAHIGGVLAVAVTPDGKQVVSGSRDRTIHVWDIETGSSIAKIDVGAEILCLALSPDGTRVYVGGRGSSVHAYDLATGKRLVAADVHKAYASDLAVSPDGTRLYVAGDGGLAVVGAEDLKPIEPKLEGTEKAVFSVAVSRDGEWILAGDADSGLWLWKKDQAKPYWFSTTAHAGPIHSIALTPDVAETEGAEEPPPLIPAEPEDGAAPPIVPPDGEGAKPAEPEKPEEPEQPK